MDWSKVHTSTYLSFLNAQSCIDIVFKIQYFGPLGRTDLTPAQKNAELKRITEAIYSERDAAIAALRPWKIQRQMPASPSSHKVWIYKVIILKSYFIF